MVANLRHNETFLAKSEMNSINTSNGNRARGQPADTNKEKIFKPCLINPKMVTPSTTVKLIKNVTLKWEVDAKLYGTIPIRSFLKTNGSNA